MDPRKIVIKETTRVAIGELICSTIMVGVFAALGQFQWNVVWSALAGSSIITLNYFFMAITVSMATDLAKEGNVQQAQKMVQLSSTVRLIVMGVALFIGIKVGGNVVALVLPLVFMRPILMLTEFFGKKGDAWTESK